jgi:phage terminase small subunit
MTTKPPSKRQPPSHLSAEAKALWRRLHRAYVFDLEASVLLLTALAESWDRARSCREALTGQPLTITDKHGGVRVHPLVVEERQAREQVTRLARVLRIHLEGGHADAA